MTDEEFARLFEAVGAAETSRRLGVTVRNVYARRRVVEGRLGRPLISPNNHKAVERRIPHRAELDIDDGVVLIGSDAHYWPGIVSTAHRALIRACREMKPRAVILNGDVFDGAGISRFPSIGWETKPSVIEEIEACKERMSEIELAAPKGARLIHTLGNHDMRFETRLAAVAPEYAKVHGVHLKDHLPNWEPAWSCWINDEVVVKHRFKGGIHGVHNNTLWAGKTMITGHDHAMRVSPVSDYNGTRWGVSSGCLAEPYSAPFVNYTEDAPLNWRSGFVVLTFERGRLLWPEFVYVIEDGLVGFRGKTYRV